MASRPPSRLVWTLPNTAHQSFRRVPAFSRPSADNPPFLCPARVGRRHGRYATVLLAGGSLYTLIDPEFPLLLFDQFSGEFDIHKYRPQYTDQLGCSLDLCMCVFCPLLLTTPFAHNEHAFLPRTRPAVLTESGRN